MESTHTLGPIQTRRPYASPLPHDLAPPLPLVTRQHHNGNAPTRLCEGTEQADGCPEDVIRIPDHMVAPADSLAGLIDHVYPTLSDGGDLETFESCAILARKKRDVEEINNIAMERMPGEVTCSPNVVQCQTSKHAVAIMHS